MRRMVAVFPKDPYVNLIKLPPFYDMTRFYKKMQKEIDRDTPAELGLDHFWLGEIKSKRSFSLFFFGKASTDKHPL